MAKILNGTLKSGMEWKVSMYTGEILIHGQNAAGEMEWLVPCCAFMPEEETDELMYIGSDVNDLHLEEKAEKYGQYYGTCWMDDLLVENGNENLRGLDGEAFDQMLANANDPASYGKDDQKTAFEEIFGDLHLDDELDIDIARGMLQPNGWLGEKILEAAEDAAWDTLQLRMEQDSVTKKENA